MMAITTMEYATCAKCKQALPLDSFHTDQRQKSGHHPYCKGCRSELFRARKAKNPERTLAKGREATASYRDRHREELGRDRVEKYWANHDESLAKAYVDNRRPSTRKRMKNSYTMSRYGISVEDYDSVYAKFLADQDGLCAVCRTSPDMPLRLDHCHETGALRALLCDACNQALGMMKEDPDRILNLAAYADKCRRFK